MRRLGALALLVAVTFSTAAPAVADLRSDLTEVQRRIEALRSQAGENRNLRTDVVNALLDAAADLDAAAADLADAEHRLAVTQAEIAATEEAIAALQERIAAREARIAEIRESQEELREAARRRAVEIYMSASEDLRLPALPEDLSEARVTLAYAHRIQQSADLVLFDYEASRLAESREVEILAGERAVLESAVGALEEHLAEQAAHREAVAAFAEEVQARVADHRRLLDRIDRDIASIDGEIAALAREENRIRAVIAQEQAGAGTAPGILLRPVPGAVSSPFGYRMHPIFGDRRLHTGWDMTAGCGTPIKAAASGRVFLSGWHGGYGNTIMIDHGGGMATLYAHQSSLGASYNQWVEVGQVIGWVGTTGVSTGCHLHFEVRINGTPVDPTPYM